MKQGDLMLAEAILAGRKAQAVVDAKALEEKRATRRARKAAQKLKRKPVIAPKRYRRRRAA